MWKNLPETDRAEYKKMILAFASLTEIFAQKAKASARVEEQLLPIINSKYQETVFQRVFKASAEDIGNTSYDAALEQKDSDGHIIKYLIGIKTFGMDSGAQKVAQFKGNRGDWAEISGQILNNSKGKGMKEINALNKDLYKKLAIEISKLRNLRIDSSMAQIQGFKVSPNDDIQAVYHVLMPSKKENRPRIFVGEANYDKIDIDSISVLGCTDQNKPINFKFTDGKHEYRYTDSDSQLLMKFDNKNIVQEEWDVKYAEDAYSIFAEIGDRINSCKINEELESYSWLITNSKGEVELFSGFNSFYGVGSKLSKQDRSKHINRIMQKYSNSIHEPELVILKNYLEKYLFSNPTAKKDKIIKAALREKIMGYVKSINNDELTQAVVRLVFRPKEELYIPIPNAFDFHRKHPNFFGTGIGKLKGSGKDKGKLQLSKEECKFTLVFEPSGDKIETYITQDCGKAIESCGKQSYLGEWILRKVFQLKEYEPLTRDKLYEVGINGLRLEKHLGKDEIHLYFIWIDENDLPADFVG